ncbi:MULTISPECIES: hypothetical protein [unclassified Leptolyngbya]|uniref:hypothetical protein n=1 Tax=unclassified Leptolyngbya TaxID=2650499 RepID=UPI0016822E78|nr:MULTISPECIES: hypothetical protein [unclassified Leptolyngbya]MBD1910307.1 hypothetical protein [Leptolyngbya sp. FACHB-8]MBD2155781.1 hypothetical protein [Leptolyngbya sp. FACHB-16]
MVKVWKEENLERRTQHSTLQPVWNYFVEVCGFTFKFDSIEQLEQVLEYYRQKIHPSSIIPRLDRSLEKIDRSLIQRWYERLPLYLRKEPKRQKVVAALEQARQRIHDDDLTIHPTETPKGKPVRFEPVSEAFWCRTCDRPLGYGRCKRCRAKQALDPEKYKPKEPSIPFCNTCGVNLGQGSCKWCKARRS